eukprot:gene10581-biopygen1701
MAGTGSARGLDARALEHQHRVQDDHHQRPHRAAVRLLRPVGQQDRRRLDAEDDARGAAGQAARGKQGPVTAYAGAPTRFPGIQ